MVVVPVGTRKQLHAEEITFAALKVDRHGGFGTVAAAARFWTASGGAVHMGGALTVTTVGSRLVVSISVSVLWVVSY